MADISAAQVVDTTQCPNEKRAIRYQDGFLAIPFITDIEKEKINAAKEAIKLGRFQKLQREGNKLKRDTSRVRLKLVELVDEFLRIIDSSPNACMMNKEQSDTSINTMET